MSCISDPVQPNLSKISFQLKLRGRWWRRPWSELFHWNCRSFTHTNTEFKFSVKSNQKTNEPLGLNLLLIVVYLCFWWNAATFLSMKFQAGKHLNPVKAAEYWPQRSSHKVWLIGDSFIKPDGGKIKMEINVGADSDPSPSGHERLCSSPAQQMRSRPARQLKFETNSKTTQHNNKNPSSMDPLSMENHLVLFTFRIRLCKYCIFNHAQSGLLC